MTIFAGSFTSPSVSFLPLPFQFRPSSFQPQTTLIPDLDSPLFSLESVFLKHFMITSLTYSKISDCISVPHKQNPISLAQHLRSSKIQHTSNLPASSPALPSCHSHSDMINLTYSLPFTANGHYDILVEKVLHIKVGLQSHTTNIGILALILIKIS